MGECFYYCVVCQCFVTLSVPFRTLGVFSQMSIYRVSYSFYEVFISYFICEGLKCIRRCSAIICGAKILIN